MTNKHVPPEINKNAFTCPHCGAYAEQHWNDCYLEEYGEHGPEYLSVKISFSKCRACLNGSIWIIEQNQWVMIYPSSTNAPMSHEDMPEDVKDLYNEARDIVNKSPRGAAALLRLALDKLCDTLCKDCIGKKLNQKIGILVANGLTDKLQKLFDIVRVVGNNAVHPGEISIDDNPQIAIKLFDLINEIIEDMVAKPKRYSALYDGTISNSIKKDIEKRNAKSLEKING